MNKAIKDDLVDASDATEHLLKRLPDLSFEDKVDIGARLRAVAKNCAAIDEAIKDEIKKKLKHKQGSVFGDLFKANLALVETRRFEQSQFKQAQPDLYDKYCVDQTQERITFEPR